MAPGWLFTQFICSVWVFYKQRGGVGGMGWRKEGNSNGFGTSEKLRGTGSALQQSRLGDRGTVGWGGDDVRPTPHSSHTLAPTQGPGPAPCHTKGQTGLGVKANRGAGGAKGRREPQLGDCRAQGGMGWVAPDVGWQEVTFPPRLWGQMPCGTQPMPCSAAMGLQQCPTVDGAGEAPLPLAVPSQSSPSPALPLPEAVGAWLGLRTGVAP